MPYKPSFIIVIRISGAVFMPQKKDNVMMIDTSMDWERRLSYKEKHAGWEIFKYLYWGIYVFVVGCMLVIASQASGVINMVALSGWAVVMFAIFLVIYGFVLSLHYKLMKKHG